MAPEPSPKINVIPAAVEAVDFRRTTEPSPYIALDCSTLFYIALHRPTLFYIVLHCTTAPSPSPTAPQVSLKCFTAASVVTPLLTFYVYYTVYIVPPVDFHTRTKLGWKTFSTPRPGMVLFQFPRSSSLPPLQLMPGHFTA